MIKLAMSFLIGCGLINCAVALAVPPHKTPTGDMPPSSEVGIASILYQGTGCPANSVATTLAPDAMAFTLLFDSFIAEAGPGVLANKNRKECRIVVNLKYPAGWSYSVAAVDFRGYARLEAGTHGSQQSNVYFQGKGPSLRAELRGPFEDDYVTRQKVAHGSHNWSPCHKQRPLNIESEIRVMATQSQMGLMTVDSIDGELIHVYRLQWRRC